ncbi:MAG TPA: hypothetical protein VJB57_06455 [Dehalococcoidia bacterium]|nr:hypothetical protein [Dehalococcoidia bacterium]
MTDTHAHPDGGSRDAGPLTEERFYDCPTCFNEYEERDITPDMIKRFEQADRLRQQNTMLREALEHVMQAHAGACPLCRKARAALARCQQ